MRTALIGCSQRPGLGVRIELLLEHFAPEIGGCRRGSFAPLTNDANAA